MIWLNKQLAQEKLKELLDGYVLAFDLLSKGLEFDCEDGTDIAEWNDQEINDVDAFFSISSIDSAYLLRGIHMADVFKIAELLEIPIDVEDRKDIDYPYEVSIDYKGVRLFGLIGPDKVDEMENFAYGINRIEESHYMNLFE